MQSAHGSLGRKGTGTARAQAPNVARRGFLQRPWQTTPGSFGIRVDAIRPYLSDVDVLDVGCASGFGRADWMHARIRSMAKSAVGVDLDTEAVTRIKAAGFEVTAGSADALAFDRTFDAVFAGELIEHLECPSGFLHAAHRVLAVGGVLVLTTPNPFALANVVYRLRGSALVNSDHVAWYCEDTIVELLRRSGFSVRRLEYVGHPAVGSVPRRWATAALRRALPPPLRWGTMLVVADRVAAAEGGAPDT